MQKNVLVSVSGMYDTGEEGEPIEVLLPGEYYKRNQTHYIIYNQYDEEAQKMLKNTIKIKDHTVELKKTGFTNVRMYFEKDRKTTSYYDMEEGSMLIETQTGNVAVEEKEDSLQISLGYDLYINQQYVALCNVAIKVVERSA